MSLRAPSATIFTCVNCGFQAARPNRCPRCRKYSLRSPRQTKNGGLMLLVIGGFISITILGVFALGRFIIFGMRNRPLTDGDLIGIAFFSVALFVGLCFGLLAIIEGGWRAATGRSSRVIGPGMVTLAVLLIVLGFCSALFR